MATRQQRKQASKKWADLRSLQSERPIKTRKCEMATCSHKSVVVGKADLQKLQGQTRGKQIGGNSE
tara:strand:+ start:90 stop:287 length:198 start_codon:yes stop_codon:yes gene_type:complete